MTNSGMPGLAIHVGRRLAWPALLGLIAASSLVSAAAGASPPAPGASLPTRDSLGQLEVWLDHDFLTPDAPPGSTLRAGFTFWNKDQLTLKVVAGVYVRLHPATGLAGASEGRIDPDFPGHVVADVVVPKGGAGAVDVGIHGQSCDANGSCSPADIPFPITGTGPPTGVATFELVSGSVQDVVGDPVATAPFAVTADVLPRGLWDVRDVGMPDTVGVVAFRPNDPSGVTVGSGILQRAGAIGTPYTGMMTVRRAGSVELAVALRIAGSDLVIAGQRRTITVLDAASRPSSGPAASQTAEPATAPAGSDPATSGGGIPAIAWIVLGAVIVIGGGGLLLRFLADQ